MRDLLIACATRERAREAGRLIRAVQETCTADTHLILGIDDDDPSYADLDPGPAEIIRGPRQDVAGWTNTIAVPRAGQYRAIASLGDDHVPHKRGKGQPGWDELLLFALGSRPGVAYGNDLFQSERWPTAAVISAEVVGALGYMAPPGPEHLYIDCFWRKLGEDLGNLVYLDDVIIEHVHPAAGKANWDASYLRSNAISTYYRDGAAWEQFLCNSWPDELVRLKGVLGL